jgi:GNAT superfamily N-acetyltransferase
MSWKRTNLVPPAHPDGRRQFRSADEHGIVRRRLLWLGEGDACVSHLWFFTDVDAWLSAQGVAVGYVHDMVTRDDRQGQGLLRRLVDWACTVLPAGERLHCSDRGLTDRGGPIALHLGLIAPQDYDPDRVRPTYKKLRGSDHLAHPVHLPSAL